MDQTVADPGFPVGGAKPVVRGSDVRCGHFLAKTYAKMKELGHIGDACWGCPLDLSLPELIWHFAI